jgi:hypothetical protein
MSTDSVGWKKFLIFQTIEEGQKANLVGGAIIIPENLLYIYK